MTRGTSVRAEGEEAQAGPEWGQCETCGGVQEAPRMLKHLVKCLGEPEDAVPARLLRVDGQGHFSKYWLYAALRADAKLSSLDSLLRSAWLDCCGHMSEFKGPSKGTRAQELGERASFGYDYDFGSTTSLRVKVVGSPRVPFRGRAHARLVARSLPPALKCSRCGGPANLVCAQCVWEGEALACAVCAEDHECGEEMLLPLANSPRAGVCGYTGEE